MTSNFDPLEPHLPELAKIGRAAEASFVEDPRAATSHLRLFGERLAIEVLDRHRLSIYQEPQVERLRRLDRDADLDRNALEAFHTLRKEGNKGVHAFGDVGHPEAHTMLKSAHRLVRWYWATYTKRTPPPPGPLVKPTAPDRRGEAALLRAELEAERQHRAVKESELELVVRLLGMPQVATHHGIEAAWRALSAEQQAEVEAFLVRFREEPISPEWPLETPGGLRDDKVRFVRVGGLVVTVIAPPRSDVLLVVHVGHEEDERAWAAHKRFEVNPAIGTLQVFDPDQAEQLTHGQRGGLFEGQPDDDLLAVGLPKALLPAVRSLATERELDELAPHVPPEAADGLFLLASGHTLAETLAHLDRATPPSVDTDDFAAAVQHPESKRSFVVVEGQQDLEAVLKGSVEAWRVYLHPDQRKLVRTNAKGPLRVLGGAGTGKTVALLHRANHLVRAVFVEPTDRVLVTTFTTNLAADLREQLGHLVDAQDLPRIDVINLHALVGQLWKDHGDGRGMAVDAHVKRAWSQALTEETLGLPESFYAAEWEQVVQAQDVTDEVGYLRVRREGRGVSLGRAQRRAVWKVLGACRTSLDEQRVAEPADQMRVFRERLVSGELPRRYVSALADEVQDFGLPELMFLRALVAEGSNDLFLVGDAHQRIYGHPARLGRAGIEIRGRARQLRVNYRTTAEVRRFAVAALTGESYDDLDGGEDTLDGYRSLRVGAAPEVHLLRTANEERDAVVQKLREWLASSPAESICVAAPTNHLVEELRAALEDHGVPTTVLETERSSRGGGVRLATFHRLKGLEFPKVVLTGVQDGLMPLRVRAWYELADDERKLWDRRQRCLLYVAASRARDELVVTGWGKPSAFTSRAHARSTEKTTAVDP